MQLDLSPTHTCTDHERPLRRSPRKRHVSEIQVTCVLVLQKDSTSIKAIPIPASYTTPNVTNICNSHVLVFPHIGHIHGTSKKKKGRRGKLPEPCRQGDVFLPPFLFFFHENFPNSLPAIALFGRISIYTGLFMYISFLHLNCSSNYSDKKKSSMLFIYRPDP